MNPYPIHNNFDSNLRAVSAEPQYPSRGLIAAAYQPGAFEDFVRLGAPELQKRGRRRSDYTGSTLRDNLGLQRPSVGAWRDRLAVAGKEQAA